MTYNSNVKATGKLTLVLKDENNLVKQIQTVPNLVVDLGKEFIVNRMIGTSENIMSHMAVGTNNSAVQVDDDSLTTELERVSLDSSSVVGTTVSYVAEFGAGVGTGSLTEAGIFNDATAGTMLCRTTFATIVKSSADTLTITWNITIN